MTRTGRNAVCFAGIDARSGALGKIRTPDPQIRSLVLYPAELRALCSAVEKRSAERWRTIGEAPGAGKCFRQRLLRL